MYIINAYLLFNLHLPPNKYNQTRSLLFFKETKTSHIFVEKNLRMQKVSILKSKNSNLKINVFVVICVMQNYFRIFMIKMTVCF